MSKSGSISQEELRNRINERLSKRTNEEISFLFKEANDNNTSVVRVKEIITEITGYIGYLLLPIAQHHFYRARYWGDKKEYPTNLSQLLEPDSSKTRQNRCNIEKKPVLYVSTHPEALVAECHYKPGDIYVLVQFDHTLKTEDLSCMLLGIDAQHKFESDLAIENVEQFRKGFFGENYDKYKFIEKELHTQFVRNDDEDGLTYRFTANLCDRLFSTCTDLDAIVYPSIATQGAVNNLAIRAKCYSKTYTASKAGIFEVLQNGSSRQLVGALIDSCSNLNWHGTSIIDQPKGVGIRETDPNDTRIYIAPWRKAE